jgi:hypothetical protein
MAIVEILNFGRLPGSPSAAPGILGRSSGIEQGLADEIVRLCKGWGQPPVFENNRPALLSFPLKTRAKFATNGAFAVIKVQGNTDLVFRVAVLSRSDYAAFGFNPFAVVEAGAFPSWDSAAVVGRTKLKQLPGVLPISPPPSPDDVGMVDEALHQLLASHKLYLPIDNSTAESDRCLALLIEVMPEALKQQLRFASFAPSAANAYHLAATATADCEFSGWKRLMMTLVGGTLPENMDRYVKKVRDCLAFGDLEVIKQQSKLLSLGKPKEEIKNTPAARVQTPVDVPVVASITKPKTIRSPRPTVQPVVRRSGAASTLAQMRGRRRQLPGVVIGLLVLAVTFGGGWSYLEFFHGGGGIQWSELVAWPGQGVDTSKNRVASLLEVPNVGEVYNRQLKKIHRAGMIPGLNQETDQRRGLVNLKNDAALPLLEQVDLFLELSSAGIRQGSRPDRESERLKALSHQGHVLEVEMSRLELAWHSLSSGVNWQDLTRLSDPMVMARKDSLQKAHPSAIKAAAADMNFGHRLKELGFATRQMGGMSQLLVLFQASSWSEKWSGDLYRAAEMVSPSASTMTRAYRNSAFTMVRLKAAEHQGEYISGAFADELEPGVWPGEKVADILPGLRREAGKFSSNEAPSLLAGTLQLYQALETPLTTINELVSGKQSMELYEDNRAVLFDPEVYQNYLARLRYQAGLKRPGLYNEKEQFQLTAFEAARHSSSPQSSWEDQVAQQEDPFLERWARHEHTLLQQELLTVLSRFDDNWNAAQQEVEKLRSLAGQGRDWTAVWVDLDQILDRGLVDGAQLVKQDPTIDLRVQQMQTLKLQMEQQRSLKLSLVTVRLDQQHLSGPEKVVFEFQIFPDGTVFRSEPFNIGPAAPAGSGWVGTVALTSVIELSPRQQFQGTVRLMESGRELVVVDYPSLSDRVGPGAMARPRPGSGGNLLIKTDDSWWRGISLSHIKEQSTAF